MKLFKWLAYYLLPKPYISISFNDGGYLCVPFDELAETIYNNEWEHNDFSNDVGFSLHYMTEYKYEHLPEFEGW